MEKKSVIIPASESPETSFTAKLHDLEQLETFIDKRVNELVSVPRDPSESDDVAKLCEALAKAQGEFPKIDANRAGYYENSNFADLDALTHAVRPALKANGLSITGQIDTSDDKEFLTMKLRHSSGQYVRTRIRIITSESGLDYSRTIANMKTLGFKTLLNLTENRDPDDNNFYEETQTEEGIAIREGYVEAKNQYETISSESESEIRMELVGNKNIAMFMMKTYKIKNLGDLNKKHYHSFLKKIKEYKKAQLNEG